MRSNVIYTFLKLKKEANNRKDEQVLAKTWLIRKTITFNTWFISMSTDIK